MTLQIYSIIALFAVVANSVLAVLGYSKHQLVFAAFAAFCSWIIWQNRNLNTLYKKIFQRTAIALLASSVWHLTRSVFPIESMYNYAFNIAIIPYAIVNLLLLLSYLDYFSLSKKQIDIIRIKGNIVFGALVIIVNFIQVFVHQQAVVNLIAIDLVLIIALAITSVLIMICGFSLIISAKFESINKNSLLLVFGFFVFATSNLVLVFSFNHLSAHRLPFQYSSLKLIGIAIIGLSVLNAKQNNLSFSFVALKKSRTRPDYNLVWVVIFLPILLLVTHLISLLDFTVQLVIIIGYQFIDYYYNKSNDVDNLRQKEADNMLRLKNELDKRIKELTFANRQLDISVNQDALTGLKNRYFLNVKMEEFLKKPPKTFTFMYLDLDNFKILNDIQGHNIGDIVLQKVAKRLMVFDNETNDICRIGGDEFILLTPESDKGKLSQLASDIIASITQPIAIDNMEFNVGASIGVATIPTSVKRFKDLLRSAEIAMYIAKQSDSNNRTVFYQSSKSETIKRSNILSLSLNSNKLFKELKLIYLPIVELRSNDILAVEVSIRWKHSELGIVETSEFLNAVDQTEKTEKVMTWFIKKSIEEVGKWQVNYENRLKLHLKLSVQTLSIIRLIDIIKKTLKEFHLRPEDLCIDIKESEAIRSYAMIKDTLIGLKNIGVTIAISDFGDGKTAFHILREINFDYIKFAHIFVDHINDNARDIAILKAMIDLSKNLERVPIVPFIKNKGQLQAVKSLGAPMASGNYLKHALGSDDFEDLYLKPLKNVNK